MDFNEYWRAMNPSPEFDNRKIAARIEWEAHPEKHESIMDWLQKHGAYSERNPYFFIHDFTLPRKNIPERQPTNYQGQLIPSGLEVFSAKYNGSWGMYTREDIETFKMEEYKEENK